MKILVVTNQLPWPPSAGGRASQYATLRAFGNQHQFRIVLTNYEGISISACEELERALRYVSVIRPDINPVRSPALTRTSLVQIIRRLFVRIKSEKRQTPLNYPSLPYFPFRPLSETTIHLILQSLDWAELVQAEFHESLAVATLIPKSKPKVFVCHQAHGLYADRFFDSPILAGKCDEDLKAGLRSMYGDASRTLEIALMRRFDSVIVFTEEDRLDLQRIDPNLNIKVSPFAYLFDGDSPSLNLEKREKVKVAFVGPGNWHPNVEAVSWYLEAVYPLLRNRGLKDEARLHVYGEWSKGLIEYFSTRGAIFHGYVENLSSKLRGNISINPVFTGAGLRTKLLSAASSRSPIVTTSIGCEGLGFEHFDHCLIADKPEAFAHSVNILLNDYDLCSKLTRAAHKRVTFEFSGDAVQRKRNAIYEEISHGCCKALMSQDDV